MYYFHEAGSDQCRLSGGIAIVASQSRLSRTHANVLPGWLYLIANVLLFLTKFLGTELNGAKRWIYLRTGIISAGRDGEGG